MSALEQAILQGISHLDEEKQKQVLAFVQSLEKSQIFSYEEWLKQVRELRAEQQAAFGKTHRVDVQSLLDEVREEPTDERLGRR